MKKIDLGQAFSILANIAVLAGIVFLAIEVRQNQASLEEGNRINLQAANKSILDGFSAIRTLRVENEQVAQIWLKGMTGEDLTPVESLRFDQMCNNEIWAWANAVRAYRAFGGNPNEQAAIASARNRLAASPRYKECWANLKGALLRWGHDFFVTAVDPVED